MILNDIVSMKYKLQLLALLFTVIVCSINAQTISVVAPSHVATGENFRIAYTVSTQNVDDFRAGNIPSGIEVIAGPYTSTQSSFQMVNGHTSSSSSVTYTYTLYAEKAGTYTVPAARAHVGGKTITSRAVKLTVSGQTRKNGNVPQMHDDDAHSMRQAGSHISGNDLFVKVSANKKRVYEQEPILLTYKVYTLVDLTSLDGKMPDLTGFHTQEIPLPTQKSFHVEKVNGRNYRCVTWSQYVMYPQMTGKLKIPSITFKGIVVQQNRSVDPFEAFFNGGSGYVEVKRDIVAPGLDVQVDALPNKPVGFSGGVGKFSISAQVDHATVKAGTPVTLRVVVGGTGNLKLIKQPIVTFPKDFDKYDPKVTDKTSLSSNGIGGNMIYDFLVVPRNQGKYTIPAISLTYYDTQANAYRTVSTQPVTLTVTKGDGSSTTIDDYSGAKGANDILPIKKGSSSLVSNQWFFGSVGYMLSLLVPFLVFVAMIIIFRKRAIDNADVIGMKGKKANKVAIKRLRKADKLMHAGKQAEFYDEVLRALWGYVGDKLNMPVEQLSRENIAEKLSSCAVNDETVGRFIGALDECEYERYAPGDPAGNMNKTYTSALEAIMDIENSMKKIKKGHKFGENKMLLFTVVVFMFMHMSSLPVMAVDNKDEPQKLSAMKNEADEAYGKGNYQQAISLYNELLKNGQSVDVYYNLGNAYYRSDNIPQALLAYERASLLDPSDKAVRFNLEFVNGKTIDKVGNANEMFFVVAYRSIVNMMSLKGWTTLSITAFMLSLLLALAYLFGTAMWMRKSGFYGALLAFVVFASSVLFAWQQHSRLVNRDGAIVVAPVVNVKKTPADSSSDAFVIHEGTRVTITDSTMRDWYGVKLNDGREGWIKKKQIELI